jgi:hypothetical protein
MQESTKVEYKVTLNMNRTAALEVAKTVTKDAVTTEMSNHRALDSYDIVVLSVPESILMHAPPQASAWCDFQVEAQPTKDANDGDFDWECSSPALVSCNLGSSKNSVYVVPGGSLRAGNYTFTVTCRESSATATVEVFDGYVPVRASINVEIPPEASKLFDDRKKIENDFVEAPLWMTEAMYPVSLQDEVILSLNLQIEDSCTSPPIQTWCLCGGRDDCSDANLIPKTGTSSFIFADILNYEGVPSVYHLRLVLSRELAENATACWHEDLIHEHFDDHRVFEVYGPPSNGSLVVTPPNGTAVMTPFKLQSGNWSCVHLIGSSGCLVGTELPFQYCFSYYSSSLETWSFLTSWGAKDFVSDVIFGNIGNLSVRAEAKDYLGSVSEQPAMAVINLRKPAVINTESLLDVLSDISFKSSGDSMATIRAVSAIATLLVASDPVESIALELFEALDSSVGTENATSESIEAVAGALTSVIQVEVKRDANAGNNNAGSTKVDAEITKEASNLLEKFSAAGRELPLGIAKNTASMLTSAAGMIMISGSEIDDAQSEAMEETNDNLRRSIASVGEAVIKARPTSDTIEIQARDSDLKLVVRKETRDSVQSIQSVKVGGFEIPKGSAIALPDPTRPCQEVFMFQSTYWPQNPFRYYGNRSVATGREG